MLLVTFTQALSVPLDSKFPTWQSVPSWFMQDVACTDSCALLLSCTAAALQEGTKRRILLMGQALIFPMASGSDSPFLSHSSWHCHTYLTRLNPPLSLYQRIRNPSTVICLGQNNFLRGAIFRSSSCYWCLTGNHLMLFCSKCHLSPFPSILPTLCCFTWLWNGSSADIIESCLSLFIYFLHSKLQINISLSLLNMGIWSGNSKEK